jgi:hypothetical protein
MKMKYGTLLGNAKEKYKKPRLVYLRNELFNNVMIRMKLSKKEHLFKQHIHKKFNGHFFLAEMFLKT